MVATSAVGWSLQRNAGTLTATLAEIEFVQADPIQAPARAQDLILRQRVRGYRVGDLDRHYPELDTTRTGSTPTVSSPAGCDRSFTRAVTAAPPTGSSCSPTAPQTCWRSYASAA